MSDYSEAERRLIESRTQANAAANAAGPSFAPSSVDQLSTPRIDKRPEAKDVDLKGMTTKVNEAAKQQQENAPTVFDTVDKDMPWLKWVTGTLATVGAAYGISKLLGGGDDNTPPDDNNPPNNRSKSLKDRSFTKTEPTFNSAEATQAAMTAGEPKFVADPEPLAPKPVTDVVNVPAAPATTASIIPTTGQPQQVPVPSEPRAQIPYGETKYNVPTASPNVMIAPPADVAPAPVQPKPIDPVTQARIDKIAAETALINQRAAQEAERHANNLAKDVVRAEAKSQKSPSGKPFEGDDLLQVQSKKNEISKAIDSGAKLSAIKLAPAASTVPLVPAAPVIDVPPVTTAPTATPPAPAPAAAPAATSAIEGAVAPKAKWPGGAEGSATQLFGGTKKNFTPESQASLEMFKDYVGKPLSMPPSGGRIHQIEEAGKFYEKYTGKPLPRSPEGKLTPIPESQIRELHSGIRTELEDAVKGNKLGSLGKGAMAAAALLGLTTAVQAAQKGDFGPLRQAGFDIGGPVALGKLGIAALSRAAGAGFSAATYAGDAGEANEAAQVAKKFADAQKLGSPFRSVPPKK
jgi:hypothetical protein